MNANASSSLARLGLTSAALRRRLVPHQKKLFSCCPPRLAADFTRYTMPSPSPSSAPTQSPAGDSKMSKKKRTAYIALGSNMGDRIGWIEKACREMDSRGIRVRRTSSLWETEPMYVVDQDRFVNGACEVETDLEPLALLDELQAIEKALGRRKLIDKGPRNIDLDILLYDGEKVDHERLKIPHIGIPEREFVLRPLAQLAANKPLDMARPWKLVQDYLNELPPAPEPLTTLTPLSPARQPPLQALRRDRRTHVMAILNVTPDSFSDGGLHYDPSAKEDLGAVAAAVRRFVAAGATMIDVGGQSTAPGRPEVPLAEELARVVPAVRLIRSLPEAAAVAVSVDTYRAAVAEAAVAAGADLVNDVSAGNMDPDMLPTVARLGVAVCLMHMRGTPATMSRLNDYGKEGDIEGGEEKGLIPTVARELLRRVEAAEAAGVRRWRILLDPGLGFAKLGGQNLEVLRRLDELRRWPGLEGLPWLVGSSRKSFVGRVVEGLTPSGSRPPSPAERVWGTAATVAAAVQGGADVVRVHDVAEMAQVVAMSDAIWRY